MTGQRKRDQEPRGGRHLSRPPFVARLAHSVHAGAASLAALLLAALGLPAPAAASDVTIAVAAPLTGPQAAEGKALAASAARAIAAANTDGGLGGRTLTLITHDDACDDEQAVSAATAIVALKPDLVVGHPCGAAALAAARVYGGAGVLFIATAPRHPDLTRRRAGPTVFRLAGRDDLQSVATASFIATAYAGRRLAIVHDRTRYARTLVEGVRNALAGSFGPAIPEFGIVASSKDYAATISGLRAHRADIVYFAGFPSEAVAIWSQLRGVGRAPDLLGSDALANAETELRAIAGVDQTAVRVIRPFIGSDAASATHAAIEAWIGAARQTGATDPGAIAQRLARDPIPTAIGPLSFDAAGDARVPSFAVATLEPGGVAVEAIEIRPDLSRPDVMAPKGSPAQNGVALNGSDGGGNGIGPALAGAPDRARAPEGTLRGRQRLAQPAAAKVDAPDTGGAPAPTLRPPPLPSRHPLRGRRRAL